MKNPQQGQAELSRCAAPDTQAERATRRFASLGATLVFCSAACLAGPAPAAAGVATDGLAAGADVAGPGPVMPQKPARQSAESALDRRIALLAAELDLKPAQQLQVKALLLRQREAVQQVWGDTNLPPPIRVSRTQAISDRTADGIRALLDEEQRKKYVQPRQREASVGNGGASVEAWTARAPGP